jgi:hypothetical protein
MFGRMEKRWERRWEPVVTRLEARASRVIEGRAPAQVWEFIRPAESTVLIDPSVVRAFTVPGTGPGVGEQQCFVTRAGGREVARLVTVLAVEEGAFAEVASGDGLPQGCRFAVEEVDGGTRLMFSSWVQVPQGAPVDVRATQAAMNEQAQFYVARVKVLLEAPPPVGGWP